MSNDLLTKIVSLEKEIPNETLLFKEIFESDISFITLEKFKNNFPTVYKAVLESLKTVKKGNEIFKKK